MIVSTGFVTSYSWFTTNDTHCILLHVNIQSKSQVNILCSFSHTFMCVHLKCALHNNCTTVVSYYAILCYCHAAAADAFYWTFTLCCQLISPLSECKRHLFSLKSLDNTIVQTLLSWLSSKCWRRSWSPRRSKSLKSLRTPWRPRKWGVLEKSQNSLSQPEISSPGTTSSRGYLSKFEVSDGPCTFGVMGGSRLRLSRPSQSKPWNQRCFLMSATPSFW